MRDERRFWVLPASNARTGFEAERASVWDDVGLRRSESEAPPGRQLCPELYL